jgi:hypothetical protein
VCPTQKCELRLCNGRGRSCHASLSGKDFKKISLYQDSLTHSTRKNVDPTNATNKPKSLFVKVNERKMEHGGRTMGTQHEPELRPKQSMLIISNRNIKLC